MSRLLLVRHGETELKSSEKLWGATDVKLSALGNRQAERLRDRLAKERIASIYSSNLQRAVVTAEVIASRHALGVIKCAELREINFGHLEGLTFEEVSQLYPEVVKLRLERNPKLKYPGGDSFEEFGERVSQFLSRLEQHGAEETILIVAHSGVLRVLLCRLLNMDLSHIWQFPLDLASLSVLETNNKQVATLSLLNDVSHLIQI